MAEMPSIYQDIEDKLNSMGRSRFKIEEDPDYAGRVNVIGPGGKRLPLNLENYHNKAGSRIWLLGSGTGNQKSVVQPLLEAHYDETKEDSVDYQYHSSSDQLGRMIHTAFNKAGRKGDVKSEFQQIKSLGNEELGLQSLPSLPRGWQSSQTKSINSIAFMATSNKGLANPDERRFIQRDMEAQYRGVTDERQPTKEVKQRQSEYDKQFNLRKMDFGELVKGQYLFKAETGALQPSYGANAMDLDPKTGMWNRVQDPGKELKSDITSGKDPAFPFKIQPGGVVARSEAGVTNDLQRPNYAKSNVLFPDEGKARTYERRTWLLANNVQAGASTAYHTPEREVDADFWGTESEQTVNIGKLNMNKLLKGEQSFSMNDKQLNRWHGGGVPQSKFGKLMEGEDSAEDINLRFGASNWRSTGEPTSLSLPKYFDPVTGEFSSEGKEGYVETGKYSNELMEKTGFKIETGRPIDQPFLSFPGVIKSSTSIKGMNLKMTETPTGIRQKVSVGGKQQEIARFGGDVKGSGFLYGFYGGMDYKQLSGIVGDYAKQGGGKVGKAAQKYIEEQYGQAAREGRELNVSFDDIAQATGYEGGGQSMMVDIFNKTIRRGYDEKTGTVDPKINARNIEKYGAGFADPGQKVSYGTVAKENLTELHSAWREANPGQKFTDTFEAKSRGKGIFELSQITKPGDLVMDMLTARRTENVHRSRFSFDFLAGVNKQFPELAQAVGADLENFEAKTPIDQARLAIFKYGMFQSDVERSYKGGDSQGELPTDYEDLSSDKLQDVAAYMNTFKKGVSVGDKMKAVVDKFFPKGEGTSDRLLYNRELNQYLPNPRALTDALYSELGVESAGILKPWMNAIEEFADIEGDMELKPEDMQQRARKASGPLLDFTKKMISQGSFIKDMMSTNIPGGISGRVRNSFMLRPNEVRLPQDRLEQVAREQGVRGGKGIRSAVEQLRQGGFPVIEARNPMPTTHVASKELVNEQEYAMRHMSQQAYHNIQNNPIFSGMAELPFTWAREWIGDWDADPITGFVGARRTKNGLIAINDSKLKLAQSTLESIDALEKKYFPSKDLRNKANANIGQLQDFAEGKIPALSAMDQKKQYDPATALGQSFERMINKQVGMGVGFNPRRTVEGTMTAAGYSEKEIERTLSTNPMSYQPALDSSLTGAEAAGVPSASLLATAYFKQGADKEGKAVNMLHISKNVDRMRGSREINDPKEGTKFIPDIGRQALDLNVDSLFTNKRQMRNFSTFVAETHAQGFDLKGKNVAVDNNQMAAWFARPGEQEMLAKKLGSDRNTWTQAINAYHQDIIGENSLYASGVNEILQTPAFSSIITNAGSKAMNKETQNIAGEQEAYEALMGSSSMSKKTSNMITSGMNVNDLMRRFKNKNMSTWTPANVANTLQTMQEQGGDSVLNKWYKGFVRQLDVQTNLASGNSRATLDPKSLQIAQNYAISQATMTTNKAAVPEDPTDMMSPEEYDRLFDDLQGFGSKEDRDAAMAADYMRAKDGGQPYDPKASTERPMPVEKRPDVGDTYGGKLPSKTLPKKKTARQLSAMNEPALLKYANNRGMPIISEHRESKSKLIASIQEHDRYIDDAVANSSNTMPDKDRDAPVPGDAGYGGQPPNQPPAPPSGPPSDDPPDDDDGKKKQSRRVEPEVDLIKQRQQRRRQGAPDTRKDAVEGASTVPASVQAEIDADKTGLPRHVGTKIRGVMAQLNAYQSSEHTVPLFDQLNQALEKTGYAQPEDPEERTPTELRRRMETALRDKPTEFRGNLPRGVIQQAKQIDQLQKDFYKASMAIDNAPGMAGDRSRFKGYLKKAFDTSGIVERDIDSGAHLLQSLGNIGVKNNFVIQNALRMEQEESFQTAYKQLQPIMGMEQGSKKQLDALAKAINKNPELQDQLAGSMGAIKGEYLDNLPKSVVEMGQFAQAAQATPRGKDLLKDLNPVMQLNEEQIKRLTKVYDEQAKAQKELQKIQEKGNDGTKEYAKSLENATFAVKKANAAANVEQYKVAVEGKQATIDELSKRQLSQGGSLTSSDSALMSKTLREQSTLFKRQGEAEELSSALQDEEKDKGGYGRAARRLLGGFGMMYFRSIGNLVTQGQGYGQQERLAYEQAKAGTAYQAFGQRNVITDQGQIAANQKALMGSNFNAVTSLSQLYNNTPALRDIGNIGTAGVGTWGMMSYIGDQMPDRFGGFLKRNAAGLGLAAAGVSLAADAWGRSQDPSSLGSRIARGEPNGSNATTMLFDAFQLGPADTLAYGINVAQAMGGSGQGLGNTEKSRMTSRLVSTAADRGLTYEQMMNTQVEYTTGNIRGLGFERYQGMASGAITKSDAFNAQLDYFMGQNPSLSQDALAQGAAFSMRNNLRLGVDDQQVRTIAEDYQFGGWGAKTAQGALLGLGYTPTQMYERGEGGLDRLGALQMRFASGEYDEEQRAVLATGMQALGQIQGSKYIEGVGSKSTVPVTEKQIEDFLTALGTIAGMAEGETFMAEQNAANIARRAGMEYTMPDINEFVDADGNVRELSTEENQRRQAMAGALSGSAQARIGVAQGFAQQASVIGQDELGAQGYQFLMSGDRGQQWRRSAALNGDPMMLARLATQGLNLGSLPGAMNIQDREIDANYLANTDISNDGRITGLSWGTTSLQRGSISSAQMGERLGLTGFGAASDAMINGFDLQQPVTLPDGTVVNNVAGSMGLRRYSSQKDYDYQIQQMDYQRQSFQRDEQYQLAMWGIQDRQRDLGRAHQMTMFGFQEQQMGLQAKSIEMNDRFWQQNTGLQQRQTTMQRGWTRQDWAADDQTRAMQWGWQVEDFAEERRFMTGRQRRVAERQMQRSTTMKNVEDERIEKGRNRQEEMWKLEDERFMLQKTQHAEQLAHQKEQLKLQQKQFEENKKYFLESKKLEDEMIALQRAHWLANQKQAKEQLELTQEHQKEMLQLKMITEQWDEAAQLVQGTMNTLTQDSLVAFQEALMGMAEIIAPLLGGTSGNSPSATISSGGGGSGLGNDNPWLTQYNNPYAPGYPTGANTTTQSQPGSTTSASPGGIYGGIFGNFDGGSLLPSMTNVVKTGEKGWEYVVNGQVIPHEQSVEMERAGVFQGATVRQAMNEMLGASQPMQSVSPTIIEPMQTPQNNQSGQPIVVVVNVGNEELNRYVTRAVGEQF